MRPLTRRGVTIGVLALPAVADAAGEPSFTAVFRTPAPSLRALRDGVELSAVLRIHNTADRSQRFARVGSVQPELLDGAGQVLGFSGGANLGRVPRAEDAVSLLAGGRLEILVSGRLKALDGRLEWSGADGVTGFWTLGAAPHRLRLRYRAPTSAPGLWPGSGVTQAMRLPV